MPGAAPTATFNASMIAENAAPATGGGAFCCARRRSKSSTGAIMDSVRRNILATGAAATAVAVAPHAFAQQGAAMSFYEKGPVRIRYEESGSGFPLLVIAGGGLNSTIAGLSGPSSPFNPMEEFKKEYRCIAADLRNANGGQSTGPLEIDRPWDAYTDDHIGLMDHLGIDKF